MICLDTPRIPRPAVPPVPMLNPSLVADMPGGTYSLSSLSWFPFLCCSLLLSVVDRDVVDDDDDDDDDDDESELHFSAHL